MNCFFARPLRYPKTVNHNTNFTQSPKINNRPICFFILFTNSKNIKQIITLTVTLHLRIYNSEKFVFIFGKLFVHIRSRHTPEAAACTPSTLWELLATSKLTSSNAALKASGIGIPFVISILLIAPAAFTGSS